ncbi:MAG TPA: ChbG/HpnK family deacetylase [Clostridia bacterium]|nr:ChbG/HpnK family deacetylase [Clostridia bacterium]
MKRLIVNADDFGLTAGVNRAIVECHERGVVTSTTLMATGARFEEAVALAGKITTDNRLSIGCHVVLVDGTPCLQPSSLPTLTANGSLRRKLGDFAMAAIRKQISEAEIEAEALAQFRKLQNAGVRLSHFDAHKHAHMFPGVVRPLLRAAQACGIRAVRNPFESARPLPLRLLVTSRNLWTRYAEVAVLRRWLRPFQRLVNDYGLRTTDGSLGVVVTGVLSEQLLEVIIAAMPEGTWELVCHPGYNDAELALASTRLLWSRATELQVLTSSAAREILERYGIELISYHDLANI